MDLAIAVSRRADFIFARIYVVLAVLAGWPALRFQRVESEIASDESSPMGS